MALLLAGAAATLLGCSSGSEDLARPFNLSRDAPGDSVRVSLPPLSVPPKIGERPLRPGASARLQGSGSAATGSAPVIDSPGQQAFLDAAGGSGTAMTEIRQQVDADASLARPSPQFVSDLMNWTAPPGYTTLFLAQRKGWLRRLF